MSSRVEFHHSLDLSFYLKLPKYIPIYCLGLTRRGIFRIVQFKPLLLGVCASIQQIYCGHWKN